MTVCVQIRNYFKSHKSQGNFFFFFAKNVTMKVEKLQHKIQIVRVSRLALTFR